MSCDQHTAFLNSSELDVIDEAWIRIQPLYSNFTDFLHRLSKPINRFASPVDLSA
jgi:hypothetical protein